MWKDFTHEKRNLNSCMFTLPRKHLNHIPLILIVRDYSSSPLYYDYLLRTNHYNQCVSISIRRIDVYSLYISQDTEYLGAYISPPIITNEKLTFSFSAT